MNGVEWVPGFKGSALKFNGSTRYVALKPRNLPATNTPLTILWRQNLPYAPVREENIICLSDDAPTGAIQAGLIKDRVSVRGYKSYALVSAPVPSLNAWHHIAYVFDGTRHSLYIDGKLENTSTNPPQTATVTKCELGRWWGGASGLCYYGGSLDDVRIYSRALSEKEIQEIARGGD
jgi:arabinan endo-1,5-alpha-L-arabinosidase